MTTTCVPAELKYAAIANTLRSCQLFADLPPSSLNEIAAITLAKSLEKGEYLFHSGETSCGFYIVQRGAINVHRVNATGKEQIIHIFRPGESLAEGSLATDKGYPADARAVENSQVLLVQKEGFLNLLKRQPELALRMLASMSLHLRIVVNQLENLMLESFETRLLGWLLKRCPDPSSAEPVTIELSIPKRVLAAELGSGSENLSRTLAKFRNQQLIEIHSKTLIVLSPARLNQALQESIGAPPGLSGHDS